MKNKIIFNLAVYFLLLLAIFLDKIFNLDFLKILPGVLMLYYLPGNNFNDLILFKNAKKISWNAKLSLDIVSSIAVVYLFYMFFKNQVSYIEFRSYIFIFALNILLLGVNLFIYATSGQKYLFQKFRASLENKRIILIASIPVLLFIIRLIFNPYIYELDSSQYFHIYNNILENGYDNSWLTGQRNGFALYMMYSKYISGINFVGFMKFFTPLLFYVVSIVLFDFTNRIKNKRFACLFYLLILASPFLTIGNEGVRPETFVFVFTFPIFYLVYNAIDNSWVPFLFLALIYSYITFRFHEFGIFTVFVSLLGLLILIYKLKDSIFLYIKAHPMKFLIILLPYLVLLKQNIFIAKSFFSAEIFYHTTIQLYNFIKNPHWDWWFLDNFTAIDGGNIKWHGYTFIQYYLYNGLGIIFLFVVIFAILGYAKKFSGKRLGLKRTLLSTFPIITFLLIYLTIAEILPRMGLFILPNRAWPHIMIAMIFIIILFLPKIEKINNTIINSNIMITIFCLVILGGVAGSMIGSIFMGGQVLPVEKGIIKNIKKLPQESIIVTTQVNENLVEMYGQKDYIAMEQTKFINQTIFGQKVSEAMENFELEYRRKLLANYSIIETSNISFVQSNPQVNRLKDKKYIKDDGDKLDLMKKYNLNEYNKLIIQLNKYDNINEKPIYFVYSFAKFSGVLSKREWWFEDNDPQNFELFKNYSGDDVVYKDKYGILIKMK